MTEIEPAEHGDPVFDRLTLAPLVFVLVEPGEVVQVIGEPLAQVRHPDDQQGIGEPADLVASPELPDRAASWSRLDVAGERVGAGAELDQPGEPGIGPRLIPYAVEDPIFRHERIVRPRGRRSDAGGFVREARLFLLPAQAPALAAQPLPELREIALQEAFGRGIRRQAIEGGKPLLGELAELRTDPAGGVDVAALFRGQRPYAEQSAFVDGA